MNYEVDFEGVPSCLIVTKERFMEKLERNECFVGVATRLPHDFLNLFNVSFYEVPYNYSKEEETTFTQKIIVI